MGNSRAEYQREWRRKNPGKSSAYCKKWQTNNHDRFLVMLKDWRSKNLEYVKEYSRIYCKENLQKIVTNVRNKRARYRQLEGTHTVQDIQNLLKLQDSQCNGCQKFLIKFDVDHIIPQSKGGSNGPENLQLLCPSCNRSKNDKTMEEWTEYKNKMNKTRNG